jgi:dihydrolipoamide dehydrogenase
MSNHDFDVAVIGGGPAGYVAAIRAAQLGAKVCCIEEDKLGGVCLNWGCIPTKTFIATAHLYKKIKEAHEFGIHLGGGAQLDLPKMVERKNKVVDELVTGIGFLFKSHGVKLFNGFGYFENKNTLIAENHDGKQTKVEADRIIVATGSRPMNIPSFPFNGSTIISSDELIYPRDVPDSLTIIGGGVIGCEFACLYAEWGTKIHVVEMLEHLLPLEDIDTSKTMERELKKKGVKLHLGQKVSKVDTGSGGAVARLESGEEIKSEQVLVAIGRSFNTEDINLDAVGVKLRKNGSVEVNEYLETSTPGIYAIGDVAGNYLLAYTASHEGTVAVANALSKKKKKIDYSGVPIAIFTDPEVGTAGLSEQKVKEKGIDYRVGAYQFRNLGKSKAEREIAGGVKVIADKKSDKILGVHIVGAHATDLIHEAGVAIRQGMTATELGDCYHAHPVLSEAILEALHDVHDLSVHTPKKRK